MVVRGHMWDGCDSAPRAEGSTVVVLLPTPAPSTFSAPVPTREEHRELGCGLRERIPCLIISLASLSRML